MQLTLISYSDLFYYDWLFNLKLGQVYQFIKLIFSVGERWWEFLFKLIKFIFDKLVIYLDN